jgi:ATP-dependent protease ClpP protease subunit
MSECKTPSAATRSDGPLIRDGEIVFDGTIEMSGVRSSSSFRKALRDLDQDGGPIRIRFMRGLGGAFEEALKIYAMLRETGKMIYVVIEHAVSADAVIVMSGTDIAMVDGACFMIHLPSLNPWDVLGEQRLTPPILRQMAERLDEKTEQMLDVFHRRTRQDRRTLLNMMTEETYLSAPEALRLGFVDRIIPRPSDDGCPLLHCPRRDKGEQHG